MSGLVYLQERDALGMGLREEDEGTYKSAMLQAMRHNHEEAAKVRKGLGSLELGLEKAFDFITDDIVALEKKMQKRFEAVDKKLGERFDEILGRLQTLDASSRGQGAESPLPTTLLLTTFEANAQLQPPKKPTTARARKCKDKDIKAYW